MTLKPGHSGAPAEALAAGPAITFEFIRDHPKVQRLVRLFTGHAVHGFDLAGKASHETLFAGHARWENFDGHEMSGVFVLPQVDCPHASLTQLSLD